MKKLYPSASDSTCLLRLPLRPMNGTLLIPCDIFLEPWKSRKPLGILATIQESTFLKSVKLLDLCLHLFEANGTRKPIPFGTFLRSLFNGFYEKLILFFLLSQILEKLFTHRILGCFKKKFLYKITFIFFLKVHKKNYFFIFFN